MSNEKASTEKTTKGALALLASAQANAAATQTATANAVAAEPEPEFTPVSGAKLNVGDFVRVTLFVFQVTQVPTDKYQGSARLHQGKCAQRNIALFADRVYPTMRAEHKLPYQSTSTLRTGITTTTSNMEKSADTKAGITPHG